DINMKEVIEIKEQKRELSAFLKFETGQLLYSSAFVVGIYSGIEQLGKEFESMLRWPIAKFE
ncbi:17064_t:CDS:2, partial [Dentiscutata heterogama]